MRASRLVSLLLLLQTRGRMTAEELAAALEVSTRTVYRDLDALAEAGVPVYAERGPGGGSQLVEGYRTRLTGLNADEAEALFFSGLPGPAAELGLGTVLAAAQLKVLAALPPELRGRATRVRERFHLDVPGWFGAGETLPHLPVVAEAVWQGRRLRIQYERDRLVVERLIEPLGLVLKAGVWYLVARRDGEFRTYRVSRIVEAIPTEERFERPEGFDLAAHWSAATSEFEAANAGAEITVRVAPDGLGRLGYAVGNGRVQAALATAGEPDADGWRVLTLRLELLDWAHDDLLRAADRVEVLAPADLRERFTATVARLAALYADDRPSPGADATPAAGADQAASSAGSATRSTSRPSRTTRTGMGRPIASSSSRR